MTTADTNLHRALHEALALAAPGIQSFLRAWGGHLTPERIAQLDEWMGQGLRIGVHWAMPFCDVTLVDAAGDHRLLQRFDFRSLH